MNKGPRSNKEDSSCKNTQVAQWLVSLFKHITYKLILEEMSWNNSQATCMPIPIDNINICLL